MLHKRNIQTMPRDEFLRLVTLEYLIRSNETYLTLLEDVIGRLKRGEHLTENNGEDAGSRQRIRREAGQPGVAAKRIPGGRKKGRK